MYLEAFHVTNRRAEVSEYESVLNPDCIMIEGIQFVSQPLLWLRKILSEEQALRLMRICAWKHFNTDSDTKEFWRQKGTILQFISKWFSFKPCFPVF
ncbi:hypothetical protein RIF29_27839 [Crotalaria pallida]|uniref:Uncharacterized protein n=1 Tax=Crotalaria pallida TaxID=3830 RepID=A0AAN9EUN9_CROPI